MRDFTRQRLVAMPERLHEERSHVAGRSPALVDLDGREVAKVHRFDSVRGRDDDAERMAEQLAACWNAVRDALQEYDDPAKSLTSTTATRMADILRNALNA